MDYPILITPISRALEDPAILTASSETQLQKLLDPILQTQSDLPSRLVIVIEALDECDDDILANVVEHLATRLETADPSIRSRLRFLVTSRPEQVLADFFERRRIPSFDMSTIKLEDREKDIRIFLRDELKKLANSTPYRLEEEHIRLLAKISCLLRHASPRIAIDFVAFGKSPESQLQRLQNAGHVSGLDVVYRLVLDSMSKKSDILGTVVLSYAPLSRQALIDLLHIETESLNQSLATLRAVIHVREGDAIYPIHASLRDFLTDSTRCTDSRVFVDPSRYHSMISRACLDFMARRLKKPDLRDICRDGGNLLPYACRYWKTLGRFES